MVYKRSKFNKVAQYLFFISLFWCLLGNIYSGLAEADKLTHNDWYYCVDADNLTGFTALIRSCIKKTDLFVRWGGEEFILLCNDCTGKEASAGAERLRKVVENTDISAKEKITCSIGVAEWEGLFDSSKRLLKRVDTALYKAKEEGRNRVCCQLLAEEIIE